MLLHSGGGVPHCDNPDHHVDGVLHHDRLLLLHDYGVHDSHEHMEMDHGNAFSRQNLSWEAGLVW